jgi:hypothetical protein
VTVCATGRIYVVHEGHFRILTEPDSSEVIDAKVEIIGSIVKIQYIASSPKVGDVIPISDEEFLNPSAVREVDSKISGELEISGREFPPENMPGYNTGQDHVISQIWSGWQYRGRLLMGIEVNDEGHIYTPWGQPQEQPP